MTESSMKIAEGIVDDWLLQHGPIFMPDAVRSKLIRAISRALDARSPEVSDEEISEYLKEFDWVYKFKGKVGSAARIGFKAGILKAQSMQAKWPSDEEIMEFSKQNYLSNVDAFKLTSWLKERMGIK